MFWGSLFQALGPATAKLHSQNLVHVRGMTRWPAVADLLLCCSLQRYWPLGYRKSVMYCGARLCIALNVSSHNTLVYIARAVCLTAVGWHGSYLLLPYIGFAAAFNTPGSLLIVDAEGPDRSALQKLIFDTMTLLTRVFIESIGSKQQ